MVDHPADCEICTAPRKTYDVTALVRLQVKAIDNHEAYAIAHQLLNPPPHPDEPRPWVANSINGHPVRGEIRSYYAAECKWVGEE